MMGYRGTIFGLRRSIKVMSVMITSAEYDEKIE